jgi:hypothetical protein
MYKPLFSSLFLPLLLASCAFGYQARGSLSDVAGEMRGKAIRPMPVVGVFC